MTAGHGWNARAGLGLIACIALVGVAGSALLAALSARIPAIPDPRFTLNHALGLGLPFRVVNDAPEHGAAFLAAFWIIVAALALCSFGLTRVSWPDDRRSVRTIIIAQALVCVIFSFFSIAVSSDSYAYVLWGRLYGLFGINPYALGAITDVHGDQVVRSLLLYFGNPPPSLDYGPLWILIAGMLARVEAGASLGVQVWSQRLAGAFAAVLTALALCRLLRGLGPAAVARRIAIFGFHPLVLMEAVAGAHNDMLMVALGAWAFAVVDDYPILSGVLLSGAIAVKYVAVVIAPIVFIRIYKKSGMAATILSIVAATAVLMLLFRPFWISWGTFEALALHAAVVGMSATWVTIFALQKFLGGAVAFKTSYDLVKWTVFSLFIAILAATYVAYALRMRARMIWRSIAATIWALPALNPWYVLWMSPAVASRGRWQTYAWWFGVAIFLHYRLEVIRRPESAQAEASWIALLVALAVVTLVAPIVLAFAGRREPQASG